MEDPVPDLKLEDTAAQQRRGLAAQSSAVGYNPYDTGAAAEPPKASSSGSPVAPEQPPGRKRTDLRKLSEWIQAQRRAEAARQEHEGPAPRTTPDKAPDPPHRK